eukprot:2714249-Pyramimonas_sp.AAC.1
MCGRGRMSQSSGRFPHPEARLHSVGDGRATTYASGPRPQTHAGNFRGNLDRASGCYAHCRHRKHFITQMGQPSIRGGPCLAYPD